MKSSVLRACGLAATALVAGAAFAPANEFVYYVDPVHGSDVSSGTKPDAAFQTIAKAQSAVRLSRAAPDAPALTVYLRHGTYRLERPLVFTAEDSGHPAAPVIYIAYGKERPILSGGRIIPGWTLHDSAKNVWQADVGSNWNFRQLYVNGQKAQRTTAPPPTGAVKNTTGYAISDSALCRLRHPADIEIVTQPHTWQSERLRVASISPDRIVLTQPVLDLVAHGEYPGYGAIARLENAYEWIRDGGDWYLDRSAGRLFYKPRPGEDMQTALVEAPQLDRLIVIKGSAERPVSNLHFVGLTFTEAGWIEPSGPAGLVSPQANQMAPVPGEPGCAMPAAAVEATGARKVSFEGCTFAQLGGQGINLRHGSQDDTVSRCDFHDLAASAIQVGAVGAEVARLPENSPDIVSGITISDCKVHHAVTEYPAGCGIFLGSVRACSVVHNELFDLPYSAISLGWGWLGEHAAYRTGNIVAANRIHDYAKVLVDAGGIYTNGYEVNGQIARNYIYDQHHDYGLIYLDDGSTNWSVTGNVTRGRATGIAWYLYKGSGNHAADNFTDTPTIRREAPPPGDATCSVERTTEVADDQWPAAACDIMAESGPR